MTTTQTQTKDVTERDRITRTAQPLGQDGPVPAGAPQEPELQESSTLGWIAVAVAVVAAIGLVIAGVFGGGDPLASDPAGSDVHLQNLAADIANDRADGAGSDQRLHNQAADGANRQVDVEGSDQRLHNQAADGANRQVDVEGSDQRLHNQAADIGKDQTDAHGSDQHLHNIANQRSGS